MTDNQLAILLDAHREMLLLKLRLAEDIEDDAKRADELAAAIEHTCIRLSTAEQVLSNDKVHFS